jgi:hypothetical protein
VPERNTEVFEMLIGQVGENGHINVVLGKPRRVLGHSELVSVSSTTNLASGALLAANSAAGNVLNPLPCAEMIGVGAVIFPAAIQHKSVVVRGPSVKFVNANFAVNQATIHPLSASLSCQLRREDRT